MAYIVLIAAVLCAAYVIPRRLLVAMCVEARNYPKRGRVLRIMLGLDA